MTKQLTTTMSLPPLEAKQTQPSNDEKMAPQRPSLKVTHKSESESESEFENDQTRSQSPLSKPRRSDCADEEDALRRPSASAMVEVNGRERLKRHRIEVAGQVWIPEIWGQEELLKDWIDCTAFDASMVKSNIMSARASLVQEGRIRASSSGLRIENRC